VIEAQAFEGIISLLPILLIAVVSVLLRARAARKRRRSEEAAREEKRPPEEPSRAPIRQEPRMPGPEAPQAAPINLREARPSRKALWMQELLAGGQPAGGSKAGAGSPEAAGPGTTASAGPPAAAQPPRRPQGGYRESYVYPPPLQLNELKRSAAYAEQPQPGPAPRPAMRRPAMARPAMPGPAEPRGMDVRRPEARPLAQTPPMPERLYGADAGNSIADRLERLPPLKRAVVWTEILGPPGGRGESKSRF
jgi:hypothetical protein